MPGEVGKQGIAGNTGLPGARGESGTPGSRGDTVSSYGLVDFSLQILAQERGLQPNKKLGTARAKWT